MAKREAYSNVVLRVTLIEARSPNARLLAQLLDPVTFREVINLGEHRLESGEALELRQLAIHAPKDADAPPVPFLFIRPPLERN